jgi:hypothetical protein
VIALVGDLDPDPLHAMQFRAPPLPQVSGVRSVQLPSPSDREYPLDTAGDRCLWHAGGTADENHPSLSYERHASTYPSILDSKLRKADIP